MAKTAEKPSRRIRPTILRDIAEIIGVNEFKDRQPKRNHQRPVGEGNGDKEDSDLPPGRYNPGAASSGSLPRGERKKHRRECGVKLRQRLREIHKRAKLPTLR